jgi:hypothetical protein
MTIRSTIDGGRKAPKVVRLELHRETLHGLTESEMDTAAGGQVFVPRSKFLNCKTWRVTCGCVRSVDLVCSLGRTRCPPSI